MGPVRFISGKLRFRSGIAITSIALSFLVMIIAVSVSSGFRKELRDALSSVSGDIRIMPSDLDWLSGNSSIGCSPAYLPYISSISGVKKVSSVAYRAGIVKQNDVVHGVLFKGTEDFHAPDSSALYACIPSRLASLLSIGPDDCFNAYFIGDRVKARRFTVLSVYDDLAEADDRLVLYTGLSDVRRINGWDSSRISAFEIMLDENRRDVSSMSSIAQEVGSAALLYASDDDPAVVAMSAAETYPQIFDWLSLIDFNVLFVLVLMTAVAGFNMISGLLILLFENISTIGILKSMGMTDRAIMSVFLRSSSSLVLKGMLSGNLIAVLFCAVQSATHVLTLDPDNYFISFVPVHLEAGKIVAADVIAYLLIMLSLLLPSMFISRVDPARTVRMS